MSNSRNGTFEHPTPVVMLNLKSQVKAFPPHTRWGVCERRGVVSQLLPPAVSTVEPATEAHQHQPRGHAESRHEGRLLDDACDLLRYAEVTAFLHWRIAQRESCKELSFYPMLYRSFFNNNLVML